MFVSRLSLTDFRSYGDALIAPGAGFVILTGENGAGKTNLLEAVSLLAPGRGLRGATLGEMARSGGPGGFAVAARLALPLDGGSAGANVSQTFAAMSGGHDDLPMGGGGASARAGREESPPLPNSSPSRGGASIEIGTGTTAAAPERRQVRVNGAPAAANSLSERLSVLWLTPAMDRLFADAASARRRFLDRLVLALHPGHAAETTRYEAAMRARNKLLAEERAADPEWLNALEARMAEHGHRLAGNRAGTLQALHDRLAEQPEGPFARAGLMLEGWQPDHNDPPAFQRELQRSRGPDRTAGRTLHGPHRMDLAVTHVGKNQPASLCSTGEQKALLIGLVLAHAGLVAQRSGRRPILLLDEIAAHLDPVRRAELYDRLAGSGGQVWMTGTERNPFAAIRGEATWLEVGDGAVRTA